LVAYLRDREQKKAGVQELQELQEFRSRSQELQEEIPKNK
jgi:hypothetical protein